MSTRTSLRPKTLPVIDMSQSSTASSPTILQGLSMISYAVSWTGTTPVGTLALEISNDYSLDPDGSVANTGTWNIAPITIDGIIETSASISGNTGNGFIDVTATSAYAARLLYTRGSGSGTMTIVVAGKVA